MTFHGHIIVLCFELVVGVAMYTFDWCNMHALDMCLISMTCDIVHVWAASHKFNFT